MGISVCAGTPAHSDGRSRSHLQASSSNSANQAMPSAGERTMPPLTAQHTSVRCEAMLGAARLVTAPAA